MDHWQPLAATTLVGSMPHKDRSRAIDLIFKAVPEVPVWPQLSSYLPEQMMVQYLEGLPGIRQDQGHVTIAADGPAFEEDLHAFYQAYLEVEGGSRDLEDSRFAMGVETGRSFFRFLDALQHTPRTFRALKGQIVGPFTLLTTLKDHEDKALIYNEQLQDVVLKHLTMKARWQIRRLRALGSPVILFLDEPALAGFGSSAFIAISGELIQRLLRELAEAVHREGALAGIHICANTDWGLVFDTEADIINFDAYSYFEKFALYRESFLKFMKKGRFVAWGMIPTHDPEIIMRETSENLANLWLERIEQLVDPSLSRSQILSQSLFTPSCGCGSLTEEAAERVLRYTSELGQAFRAYL